MLESLHTLIEEQSVGMMAFPLAEKRANPKKKRQITAVVMFIRII
uniref:Uncharacterized protein n=1 Tax=Lepeophtheirus salmonis TaxID=72036 RepID=A0A0K2TYD9_LEPSM